MKKFFGFILFVIIFGFGGYAAYKYITTYVYGPNTELKEVEQKGYVTLNPTLDAYRRDTKMGGGYKYYFFNLGFVDNVPLHTSEVYNHTGVIMNYEYELRTTTEEEINFAVNSSMEDYILKRDNYNYDIALKVTKNEQTNIEKAETVLGSPNSLNNRYDYYYRKATTDENLLEFDYTTIRSVKARYDEENNISYSVSKENDSLVQDIYTTYSNSKLYGNQNFKFNFNNDTEEGYYRFGIYSKCNVYAIVVLDSTSDIYYIDYNLYPIGSEFKKGYEYSKTPLFNNEFDVKFNLDLYSVYQYLTFDYNSTLSLPVKLSFNTMGGNVISDLTVNSGETVEVPTPVREGYDFDGWYLDRNYTKEFYPHKGISCDTTIYAKWNERVIVVPDDNKCKVTFETNGGSYVSPITVNKGDYINSNIATTRDGYLFQGYYYDSSFNRLFNLTDQIYSNITLYAKWAKVDSNFDPSGVILKLGERNVDPNYNKITFNIRITNNTGRTINDFIYCNLIIKVDGVVRTNAYFDRIKIGTIYNGNFKDDTVTISFTNEDMRWWREQGDKNFPVEYSYSWFPLLVS